MFGESYEKKLTKLLKNAEEATAKGDYKSASWAYQEAAKLAEDKQARKAIVYLLKAVEVSLKDSNYLSAGWAYKSAASLAEPKEAREYALKSAQSFEKAGSLYAAQWSYNIAAKLSKETGDLYAAIRYYKKAQDIAFDREIGKEIERLKEKIPHPIVIECYNKEEAEEGEDIEFCVEIDNNSKEMLRAVKLLDEKKNVLEDLGDLKIKESKQIRYKEKAKAGFQKPRFKYASWKSGVDQLEEDIHVRPVRVKPNVQIRTTINPPLRLNKPSDFIVLLKNQSASKLKDVRFDVHLAKGIEVLEETNTKFDQIKPGEERGVVLSVVPRVVGEIKVDDISVEYSDEYGTEYVLKAELMTKEILPELETKTVDTKIQKTEEYQKIQEHKESIDMEQLAISQEEYLRKAGSLQSVERGLSYDGISIEQASAYIEEECYLFTHVATHDHKTEKLYLYAGKKDGKEYLLTVALKENGKLLNILFKLYSSQKEEEMLSKIVDIVDYTVRVMGSAKRVEKVEVKEVINIIDSLVQRSKIGYDVPKNKETTIKDSVVQKANV